METVLAPFSDLSDRNNAKNAYIHSAILENNYDVFSTILAEYQARKADLNVRMELKELEYTPLLIALSLKEKVDERIPESLIDAGVDISFKFPNGKSPIFKASENNLLSVVKKLIEKGANILDVYEDEEEGIPYTSFCYSVLSHYNELSHLFLDCYAKFLQTQSDKIPMIQWDLARTICIAISVNTNEEFIKRMIEVLGSKSDPQFHSFLNKTLVLAKSKEKVSLAEWIQKKIDEK